MQGGPNPWITRSGRAKTRDESTVILVTRTQTTTRVKLPPQRPPSAHRNNSKVAQLVALKNGAFILWWDDSRTEKTNILLVLLLALSTLNLQYYERDGSNGRNKTPKWRARYVQTGKRAHGWGYVCMKDVKEYACAFTGNDLRSISLPAVLGDGRVHVPRCPTAKFWQTQKQK